MADSSGSSSAIDDKKSTASESTKEKWIGFAKSYASSLLLTITLGVFVIGGTGLYATKVAQANLMPTNADWAPFTNLARNVKEVRVDMQSIPLFGGGGKDGATASQKAVFDTQGYLAAFKDSWLCSLKSGAKPDGGWFANGYLFFFTVFSQLIAKNAAIQQSVFATLAQLPDWLIMLGYGLFGWLFWFGLYLANFGLNVFTMLMAVPQLFRTAATSDETKWQPEDAIGFSVGKCLLFLFVWLPVGFFASFLTPVWFTVYSLCMPLSAKYDHASTGGGGGGGVGRTTTTAAAVAANADSIMGAMGGSMGSSSRPSVFAPSLSHLSPRTQTGGATGGAKKKGILDFLQDVFVYKRQWYMILATISLLYNVSSYLDSTALLATALAVAALYYMGFYTGMSADTDTPLPTGFTPGWANAMDHIPKATRGAPMSPPICPELPVFTGKESGWFSFWKG